MKGTTVFFLNVAYVTLFDKGDNLGFSRKIETFELAASLVRRSLASNYIFLSLSLT